MARIGISVYCKVCSDMKKPVGRSAPMCAGYCDDDCPGYRQPPFPGSLWPGETEEGFGYPIGTDGTAVCDCIASGNEEKPKQHGADPHAKNCKVYTTR